MGDYKLFDGTNWVNPCDCDIHIMQSNLAWKELEPRTCPTRYWDGNEWCLIECETQINDKTEINIWFNTSRQLNSTLPALLNLKNVLLKNCLLPVYNNDPLLYDERVRIITDYTQRSVKQLGTQRNFGSTIAPNTPIQTNPPWVNRTIDLTVDLVINIVYSDESNNGGQLNGMYYWSQPNTPNCLLYPNNCEVLTTQTPEYLIDLALTRANVEAAIIDPNPYEIRGSMMRVATSDPALIRQREFVELLFNDAGIWTPPNNLSDYLGTNFEYKLDIIKGQNVSPNPSRSLYYANNSIDWVPGIYTLPVTTISGPGSGMILNVEARLQVDGVASLTIINGGTGYLANVGIFGSLLGGGGIGEGIQFLTNGSGEITSAVGFPQPGVGFTLGDILPIFVNGNTTATAQITGLVTYTNFVFLGIESYGDQLYSNSFVEIIPPGIIGTDNVIFSVDNGQGFPDYYLAEIVSSLNQLGLTISCPP